MFTCNKFGKRFKVLYSIILIFSAEISSGSSTGSVQSRDTYEDARRGSAQRNLSSDESSTAATVESTLFLRHKLSRSALSIISCEHLTSQSSISLRLKKSQEAESRKKLVDMAQGTGKMICEEEAQTGRVNSRIYAKYFATFGYVLLSGFVTLAVANTIFQGLNSFWLSAWSDDNTTNVKTEGTHLLVAVRLRFYNSMRLILDLHGLKVVPIFQ